MQGGASGTGRRWGIHAAAFAFVLSFVLAAPASASVERVNYRGTNETDAFKTAFDGGGLVLRANCFDSSAILGVQMRSKYDDAMVHFNSQSDPNPTVPNDDQDDEARVNDFDTVGTDPADDRNLFGAQPSGLGDAMEDFNRANRVGQIIYARPGGKVVTIDWASEDGFEPFGSSSDCAFVGTARILDSSSSSRVNFRADGNVPPATFFSKGGLTLTGSCTGGNLAVQVGTKSNDALLSGNYQSGSGSLDSDGFAVDQDFDIGDPFTIPGDLEEDAASGQLVYRRPGGDTVTVDWMAEDDLGSSFGGSKDCVFVGAARKRSSGDPKRVSYRAVGVDDPVSTEFFSAGGLRLRGSCQDQGAFGPDLDAVARTGPNHALYHADAQGILEGTPAGAQYAGDNNFNARDSGPFLFTVGDSGPGFESIGQLVYATEAGTIVSVDYMGADGAFSDFMQNCAFVGTAEVASP